jgi:hypothetical protein
MVNVKRSCAHALLIFAGAAFGSFLSGHIWPSDSSDQWTTQASLKPGVY